MILCLNTCDLASFVYMCYNCAVLYCWWYDNVLYVCTTMCMCMYNVASDKLDVWGDVYHSGTELSLAPPLTNNLGEGSGLRKGPTTTTLAHHQPIWHDYF